MNDIKPDYRATNNLSRAEATEFFDMLLAAGAQASQQAEFVRYMTEPSPFPKEFRFQGKLGFGGKAHFSGGRAYVSCYPEDDTPERNAIKRVLNDRLKGLLNG